MIAAIGTLPFAAALLLLVVIAPALSEAANKSMALPDCQATCGGVDIPYPFGVGEKCYRDEGFAITCQNGTTPFLAGTGYQVLNLSVASSEARVQLPIAHECYNESGINETAGEPVSFNRKGVYRVSNIRSEFVVLGCNAMAYIMNRAKAGAPYDYDIYTGCFTYCPTIESTVDGRCKGAGCCTVDIPPGLSDNSIRFQEYNQSYYYKVTPCSYSFLVDREYYHFSKADLRMKKNMMMPVWLDWAIRPPNGTDTLTCADAKMNSTSYACQGRNSNCTDSVNGPGYSCRCPDGYEGNPYTDSSGGCTNINECENPEKYKCYGHCEDTDGSYECKCPRGRRGKPKEAPCEPILSRVAQILIGAMGGIAFIAILALIMLIMHQKRKLRAFFKRNGGPMLESINNIKIFTKEEMNQITENYGIVLGKGGFGQVGSIAVACLKEDMDERPNMKQVVENLQLVRREWKQRQGEYGEYGDQAANEISLERSPDSLSMNATGAETPGYSPLLK
ncbi:hypothetical protein EJB05_07497, partial [Eragrostis curvula]